MSCDVSIPSIEAHITPLHPSSKNRTGENKGHSECLHHFFEHPFVLPASVPDTLIEFPGELDVTIPPRSSPRPVVRKPPITAQPNKSTQSDRNQRERALLEDSLLLAHFKSHPRVHQPPDTTVSNPLGSLLQSMHQKYIPRQSLNAYFKNIRRQPPQ